MNLLLGVLEEGFIYAIMALGVYITYKILDFPDLTVDGSFPMGAAITALLLTKGYNPLVVLPLSFLAGCIVGGLTGFIHVKLKVRDLLSGIIMMTAMYTINLRIAGKANVPLYKVDTIFSNSILEGMLPKFLKDFQGVIVALILILFLKFLLDWYLSTKSGFLLRAVGDNEELLTSLGVSKGKVKIIGLAIANGLAALSGAVYAQQRRFFDISFGTGTVVIGLACVIIGTSLFKKITFLRITTSVVIGSLLYKACIALSLQFGFASSDLKLIISILFLVILVLSMDRKKKVK